MEEDGFVIVSKDFTVEDDNQSISSSRSSLFLVEDPSADDVMLNGEKDDELPLVSEVPIESKSPVPGSMTEPLAEIEDREKPQQAEKLKVGRPAELGKTYGENLIWAR